LNALPSAAIGLPGKARREDAAVGCLPAKTNNAAWRGERGAGQRAAVCSGQWPKHLETFE